MSRVLIGIQARSGSTRLPKKAFELIGGKQLLERVIDSCKSASLNIAQRTKGDVRPKVAVLTPSGDIIAHEFRSRSEIVEGPEHDVLSRYCKASDHYAADYIVRVTGDCPLLPPFVISKLIILARMNSYDYVSNVDEQYRTSEDGSDCEVMSRKMLDWLASNASTAYDREHVTTLARREPPEWAKIGVVVHHYDHSDQKLSVDTREDLERVRDYFEKANGKYQKAVLRYGAQAVHRI
jgi:spore coat polysaccharide biosynthesis protein SpsF (cytidylyltransferase family)